MITPEPEVRRSSGVAPGSPSFCASGVRRTRTWTSAGFNFSARLFMWSLRRAMSAGALALLLSVQRAPDGDVGCALSWLTRARQSATMSAMWVTGLDIPSSEDRMRLLFHYTPEEPSASPRESGAEAPGL